MELDSKTATMLFAAIAGGSAVGDGAGAKLESLFSTETPGAQIAELAIKIVGLDTKLNDRILEAQSDHEETRRQITTNFEQVSERITLAVSTLKEDLGALDARISRLDERKADK